jgi:hypothetical protein
MIRKVFLTVLLVAVAAVAGHAANSDNAAPLSGEVKSSPSGSPSYFEGVWVGNWESYLGQSTTQDVTLKIERGVKEGVFRVEYSWGPVQYKARVVPAGSLRARGREEGDRFIFDWKNKQGREFTFTLQKYKDNVAKARIDRSGPLGTGERPYSDTYLNRK